MIVYTASDIIRQAKWFANATNSPLTDFYINTNILSAIYKDLYTDIIGNSNQFITTITTTATELNIEKAFKIVWVGDNTGREITRSSLRTRNTGGYYIENNILHLPAGNKTVKYCPLPQTITCPDDPVEVELENYPANMSNAGITEDYEITTESKVFHGTTIDFANLPAWMNKSGTTIRNVNVSDPYILVSYADNTVRLYNDEYDYTDWNPDISRGKVGNVRILAFTSDERTGKGVLYQNTNSGKYYYGSYVPDTILYYPNNTLFQLMIYKVAAIIASMLGLDNPYLTNKLLQEAEVKFYQSISKGNSTVIPSVNGGMRW